MNPMICSVLKRLFFMSVLVVDGLYSFTWYGSAGAGHLEGGIVMANVSILQVGGRCRSLVLAEVKR
jgi:hypothetical protein